MSGAGHPTDEAVEYLSSYLDPEKLREKLIHIGFFLFAFEVFRDFVLGQTRAFFTSHWEFRDGKVISNPGPDYAKVKSLAKHEFEAVLLWHVQMDAITADDAKDILALVDYRNAVAHRPEEVLADTNVHQPDAIDRIRRYRRKIGNFWGRIEVDVDPDVDHDAIDYEGIVDSGTLLLDFMAFTLAEKPK